MANVTETGQPHCGIIIPEPLTFTGTAGTDYDQADEYVGPATTASDTKTVLSAVGTLDATTNKVEVAVARGGAPNGGGAGVVFRRTVSGTARQWVGQDTYAQINGYEYVTGQSATMVVNDAASDENGTTLAIITYSDQREVWKRTHDGVWSAASVQFSSIDSEPLCLIYLGGGVWNLYTKEPSPSSSAHVLALYQSRNTGTTWFRAARSVLPSNGDPGTVTVMRGAQLGGDLLLTITTGTGTSSETKQYRSGNLGHDFALVETIANTVVWGIDAGRGSFHLVTVEGSDGAGADDMLYRRIGRAGAAISSSDSLVIYAVAAHDESKAIRLLENGNALVISFDQTNNSCTLYEVSISAIVSADVFALDSTTDALDGLVVVKPREDLVVVFPTAVNTSGGATDSVMALRVGGYSGVNIVEHTATAIDTAWDYSYIPIVLPTSGAAWGASGGATLSLAADTGVNLSAGGSDETLTRTITYGSNEIIITRWVVDVGSGICFIKIETGNHALEMEIGTASIRANDFYSGTYPGTNVPHGGTNGRVEFITAQQVTATGTATARAWFRDGSKTGGLKEWTECADSPLSLTNNAAAGTQIEVLITAGGNVDIYESHYTLSTVGQNPTYDYDNLRDIRIPIDLYDPATFLCDEMYVALVRGLANNDNVIHTFSRQSAYALSNVDPNVAPSPRTVWRSKTAESITQTLSFTCPTFNGGGYALVFDGIRGIKGVTLGGVARDFQLRMDYVDVGTGPSTLIRPNLNDASNADIWLSHDEAKGWVFVDELGNGREILGNTAGKLRTASATAPFPTFQLSSAHTGAGAGATGYLIPNRVALVFENDSTTAHSSFTLTITTAQQVDVDEVGYIELGGLYVGRIQLLPLSPDLNDTMQVRPFDVAELPDGRRDDQRLADPRTLWQFAWVGSAHEWHDMYNASPDFVGVTGDTYGNVNARALPALVEGLYRKADGKPVVWLQFPYNWDADSSYPVLRPLLRENLCVYGRIVDGFRREGVQYIGPRGNKQAYRVPALTLSEEQ